MNTALLTARVHFHGSFFVVTIGNHSYTCLNNAQLLSALAGKPHVHPDPAPQPTVETVEQFIARGGSITRITPPKPVPLPKALPDPTLKPARAITLADLGLI